jgi:CheY-like chemotaxis protein
MITRDTIKSWKVLIVDDEPDSLEVATRVLLFYGAAVYTASNGQEGLAIARAVRPTFILSDLSMPKMDGWEMRYHLASDPQTSDIPIIALTAHAMVGDRERAISVGFHYYLTKPFSPVTFLDDLLKLFAQPEPPINQPAMGQPESPRLSSASDGGSGPSNRKPDDTLTLQQEGQP